MEGHTHQFFRKINDNDTFENHCMSLVCKQNHMVRKSEMKSGIYTCEMPYVSFFEVFMCQLREIEQQCNFCKLCFNCRHFQILCYNWDGIIRNSNRNHRIYCTAVRFYLTQCMTVDFLNSGVVADDFINFVEKNESFFFKLQTNLEKQKFGKFSG